MRFHRRLVRCLLLAVFCNAAFGLQPHAAGAPALLHGVVQAADATAASLAEAAATGDKAPATVPAHCDEAGGACSGCYAHAQLGHGVPPLAAGLAPARPDTVAPLGPEAPSVRVTGRRAFASRDPPARG